MGERPKALLEVGGETLLVRTLAGLRESGVRRLVAVVGYRRDLLEPTLASAWPGAEIVRARDFASTGSMRSLATAAALCPGGALVVESDLLVEPRAFREILAAPDADLVLISRATGAGDEVWVCGPKDGRVREISKRPTGRWPRQGELVGVTRLSGPTLREMAEAHRAGGREVAPEHYEERLSSLAGRADGPVVRWHRPSTLVWAEVDHAAHLDRALREVLPKIEALSRSPAVEEAPT